MGNAASKRRQRDKADNKSVTKATTVQQQTTSGSQGPAVSSKFAGFDPNLIKQCQCSGARLYRGINGEK